jgi:nucleosome binding factor SPN SPT16 subunit
MTKSEFRALFESIESELDKCDALKPVYAHVKAADLRSLFDLARKGERMREALKQIAMMSRRAPDRIMERARAALIEAAQ